MNLSGLMNEYFRETPRKKTHVLFEAIKQDVPISVPNKKKWDHLENPEVLQRLFEFSDATSVLYFLEDVIQLQEAMAHHGRILVDGNSILIQISTKLLDRVTDLDVEWARKVDEIYDDIRAGKE